MTTDVSVIIPAYNAAAFVVAALDSVATQTLPPRELIVVDDGSSDDTAEQVERWAAQSQPTFAVQVVRQANGGISAARNCAIRHARGSWIALLDADDLWNPAHLELLLQAAAMAPDAVAAYGAGRVLTDNGLQDLLYDDFWDNPSKTYGVRIGDSPFYRVDRRVFPRLVLGNFVKPSSLMVRAAAVAACGPFNETLKVAEDREFLVRLLLAGSFVYCATAITCYRWHDDNATHDKNALRNIEWGLRAIEAVRLGQAARLSRQETQACRDALGTTARAYLASCSQYGLRRYCTGIAFMRGLAGSRTAWHAATGRQLLASVYRQFKP